MTHKINWQLFRIKNENTTKTFEDLCYQLFCRKYKQPEGIRTDYNQTGLETFPISVGKEMIGFQSKFFENKLSDSHSVNQINDSIGKAKKNYPGLSRILLYTHQSFGSKNPKYKMDIEAKAKPIKIQWITDSNFQSLLFQPVNLDLAQLYFGQGHELEFIKNNISPEINTLLLSKSFITLPFSLDTGKKNINLTAEILKPNKTIILISGSPGSGKSILMQNLFQILGGLNKKSDSEMLHFLSQQGSIPMLVNLKLCNSDTLENIIRGRQSDNNLRGQVMKFIYLFDGLDELNEFKANQVLSYIAELSNKSGTAKIIISCRSGNLNTVRARNYLKYITTCKINPLDVSYIKKYFNAKGHLSKSNKLSNFEKHNKALLEEIKDALLITILWDVIEELDANSSAIDLFEKKINHLIKDPKHQKNIEELNLLNPKENEILLLNQEISYFFQKNFQFRFPLKELQEFIIKNYPKLDYKSVNILIDYLTALFFERNTSVSSGTSFIYQHRRYQEFFFAQKLKLEFELNPSVIRELKVLSSHDFFESLFLSYLRNEYVKEANLPGLLGLNLIDVYLGKHSAWGSDNAYYKDSNQFIKAIAIQSQSVFEQLMHDESLQLIDKLFIHSDNLKEALMSFKNAEDKYAVEQFLRNVWEDQMPKLILLNALLHKYGKYSLQLVISSQIEVCEKLFIKEDFARIYRKTYNNSLPDPHWAEWYSHLYALIVISNQSLESVYNEIIKRNYTQMNDTESSSGVEQGRKKLINDFIRVAVEFRLSELIPILQLFDKYQFLSLLNVLTTLEFIPFFFSGSKLQKFISTSIELNSFQVNEFHHGYTFFKKVLGKEILAHEMEAAKKEFSILEKQRGIDFQFQKNAFHCAVISFIFDRYNFNLFLTVARKHSVHIYNELGIFCTLFGEFVLLLKKERNIASICGNFVRYCKVYDENHYQNYFTSGISEIFASIFNYGIAETSVKKQLAKIVIRAEYNINPFEFYLNLKYSNNTLFQSIITEPELESLEKEADRSDVFFQDYINTCFELSVLFAEVNDNKSVDYFIKGINDSIIRHGWRKDYIVSYLLTDAFEIILRNKWADENKIYQYAFEILALEIRVSKITDGKGTQHGPFTFIKRVAHYDLNLTEKLIVKLESDLGDIGNSTIAAVIRAKINEGLSYKLLDAELEALHKRSNYKGKIDEDFFLERFKTYLTAATNYFYSEAERSNAFENAYSEIEKLLAQNYDYINFDMNLADEFEVYQSLCTQYKKKFNVPDRKEEKKYKSEYSPSIEAAFRKRILSAKTRKTIDNIYKELNKSDNMKLQDQETWFVLINKTYEILGNIMPFIKLMEKNLFPHSDYFTYNAHYIHFGLAAALKNINTKDEALQYLYKHSGHGGFANTMKAFEVLRDKQQCIILFDKFLGFCKLLVN